MLIILKIIKKIIRALQFCLCVLCKTYPTFLVVYFCIFLPFALISNGVIGLYETLVDKEFFYKNYKKMRRNFKC